ncbi:MAG: VOC family protein [Mycobacteriales bacterium]
MIDHVGIQVDDMAASKAFYTALLQPLGKGVSMDFGEAVGFGGPGGAAPFWISASKHEPQRECHVAFSAERRDVVEAVHALAVEHGWEVLHAPREFPEYHPGYYGVFLRDPDGNNVEVVDHGSRE